jgi:branched-subunit amino acid aminotransferase/4-amino-4-deoxychorismate lyase
MMVTVKEPGGISAPQRLQSVRYQRPDAHLKHLATGQGYYGRLARRNGFDDALLASADGAVSETAMANIGFFDESGIVWPDAPLLRGVTMQLLEQRLPTRRTPVRVQGIGAFSGAFVANARGLAAVSHVDDVNLPVQLGRMKVVDEAYAAVPWDAI